MKKRICSLLLCMSLLLVTLGCSQSEQEKTQVTVTQETELSETERETVTEILNTDKTEVKKPDFFIYQYPDKLSYEEAKERFAHPIVDCKSPDFVGYYVSYAKKDIRPERCLWVTYKFKNGKIDISDESRIGGRTLYDNFQMYEYNGDAFYVDANTVYYILRDELIMTAQFDGKELNDVCGLMKSLKF